MLFRLCAGLGIAVLLLGVVGLVLVNHWALEAAGLTDPITEEELMDLRDAMIRPAIDANRLGQS